MSDNTPICLRELILPVVLALSIVLVTDVCTNSLDIHVAAMDAQYYVAMAQDGFGNAHAVAPYAYRFGATLPVHLLYRLCNVPVFWGFKLLAYLGAVATLGGVYILARRLRFPAAAGLLCMLVTGFSRFHVAFLQFDVSRPDHLAYPLLILAMLMVVERRWLLATVVAVLGLQVREYLILPLAVMCYENLRCLIGGPAPRLRSLLRLLVVGGAAFTAVLLPRWGIDVDASAQRIDPLHSGEWLKRLFADPLNWRKDVNYLLALLTYMLPVLLLVTRERLRRVSQALSSRDLYIWGGYSIGVLFLAIYGGSDYDRFMTYLFLPQCLLLCHLWSTRIQLYELAGVGVAMIVVNRLFQPFPIWDFWQYIDQFAWGNRVTAETVHKFVVLLAALVGMAVLRIFGRAGKGAPPPPQAS